jgi:holo-[acyl-carrier protein] synthase
VVERDVRERGIAHIHVTMSHDAGVATAFVVTERDDRG